ncbi:hypothetical protein TeGR_g14034, partial [Tetraparma gracilis]
YLLKEADVVLVGVSRTGKTPLSVVLAQTMGLKVANVPLVLECDPPAELLSDEMDHSKVFCLTINPNELKRIRVARLERSRVTELQDETMGKDVSNYADRNYMLRDLTTARKLAARMGWVEVDVTGRAVEETASYIDSLLKEAESQRVSEEFKRFDLLGGAA